MSPDSANDLAARVSVVIVMGVSGSGKSTIASMLANKLGWPMRMRLVSPKSNVDKMAGQPLRMKTGILVEAIARHIDVARTVSSRHRVRR